MTPTDRPDAEIETMTTGSAEPVTDAEPAAITEPVKDAELATDAEPAAVTEPAMDTEPATDAEPVTDAEPAAVTDTDWAESWNRHFPDWETEMAEEADAAPEEPDGTAEEADAAPKEAEADGTAEKPETVPVEAAADRAVLKRPSRSQDRRRRRRRSKYRGLRIFLALLSAALLLAGGVWAWERFFPRRAGDPFIWTYPDEEHEHASKITIPQWHAGKETAFLLTEGHGDSLSPQEVYKTVNPSVVTVVVDLNDISASVGTGVVFTDDGYMLTNYHVVEGGRDCMAILDRGQRCEVKYVAGDEASDLAVMKLDAPEDFTLSPAEFGDSNRLIVGDAVYAIGNPLGIELRGTMTNGIVSAATRDVRVDGRTMSLIQTNAALNSGNSGGPLINEFGQVVGLNVMKMSSSRSTVEGLGFAIPSASMERLVNDLLSFGEVKPLPSMGIMILPDREEAEEGVRGLKIKSVDPDSPADRAGLLADDFLLSADGVELESGQDLYRARNRHHLGEQMTVTVWRNGERVEASLTLDTAVQED